jgi:hypothetical protein
VTRARRGATKPATRTVTTHAHATSHARQTTTVVLEQEADAPERAHETLDRVLEKVSPVVAPKPSAAVRAAPAPPMLRTARVVSMAPGKIEIAFRGTPRSIAAELGDGVDRELVALAMKNRDVVLVEWAEGATPVVVGVVQTRIPAEISLKADKITIEAEQELTLRSGTAAMRLREDGDVEVVGSRIAIASRGLFRLVGRMLRLN